jgi:hypothetical protein
LTAPNLASSAVLCFYYGPCWRVIFCLFLRVKLQFSDSTKLRQHVRSSVLLLWALLACNFLSVSVSAAGSLHKKKHWITLSGNQPQQVEAIFSCDELLIRSAWSLLPIYVDSSLVQFRYARESTGFGHAKK